MCQAKIHYTALSGQMQTVQKFVCKLLIKSLSSWDFNGNFRILHKHFVELPLCKWKLRFILITCIKPISWLVEMTVRVHYISSHLMLFEDTISSSVRIQKHLNRACGNNSELWSVRAAVWEMRLPASLCLSARLSFYPHRTAGIQTDRFL